MKLTHLMPQLGAGLCTFCLITTAHAGIPLWSFTPDTNFPPKNSVSVIKLVFVQYTITNNSSKARNLIIKPRTGVSQNAPCRVGPKGSANATCTLTLTINGSLLSGNGLSGGPHLCQANPDGTPNSNQCYQPSKTDSLDISLIHEPILSASTMNLALSVKGLTLNGLASGQARTITITNRGNAPADGLVVNYPSWPGGSPATSASDNCRSILAAGDSCTITVTPGTTATDGADNAACTTGIAPTPGVISVTASNANQVSTNVAILGYGCIYQGGFVYAMTETEHKAHSIGGMVASLSDQAAIFPDGMIWSSNGGTGNGSGGFDDTDVSFDILPGIDETSTSSAGSPTYTDPAGPSGYTFTDFFTATYTNSNPFTSSSFRMCNGNSDGNCNTGNILTFYNEFITHYNASGSLKFTATKGPTLLRYYAAGLCVNYTIDASGNTPCSPESGACYTNWYLPAICEMGYDANGFGNGCGTSSSPTLQNMQSNLVDNNSLNLLAGYYWSSSESSCSPQNVAWYQYFAASEGGNQGGSNKNAQLGVRCVRGLTY